jgi:curli biogenesis system outer membrane secretion channel CsgG
MTSLPADCLPRLAGLTVLLSTVWLGGCLATAPSLGGGSATAVTGATAGGAATQANSKLERCSEPLGTVRIEENVGSDWYRYYASNYKLGSTVPLLRMLVQQSNCFVVLERGRGMAGIQSERNMMRQGEEGRAGSNFGPGQQVGADYSMSPEIMMSNKGGSGVGGALGGFLNRLSPAVGSVAGGAKLNEAGTVLMLVDVRSTVQIAAAEGYSKNWDFNLGGAMFGALGGGLGAGSGSAYTNTPEGKVVASAFVDAYNKMVVALRSYKEQQVKGGLGTGGRLGVQGGQTPSRP